MLILLLPCLAVAFSLQTAYVASIVKAGSEKLYLAYILSVATMLRYC